ncbi:hypothetical protein ACFSVJ_22645 [Prauserella oleivorans]
MAALTTTETVDLSLTSVRELNAELHQPKAAAYEVLHPQGAHALAAGSTTTSASTSAVTPGTTAPA